MKLAIDSCEWHSETEAPLKDIIHDISIENMPDGVITFNRYAYVKKAITTLTNVLLEHPYIIFINDVNKSDFATKYKPNHPYNAEDIQIKFNINESSENMKTKIDRVADKEIALMVRRVFGSKLGVRFDYYLVATNHCNFNSIIRLHMLNVAQQSLQS